MRDACNELFNYTMGFVTPGDLAAFAPSDPGYPNYVREWTLILSTRSVPLETNFDITETVGLTRWANADRESDPVRFRRFRVFTDTVALSMAVLDRARDDHFPPNYTLISLIDDADALQDSVLCKLLVSAIEQAHEAYIRQGSQEAMFGLLGLLILNARQGAPDEILDDLATRLIDEESRCEYRVHAVFLFGCTGYDQLNHLWKRHIADLIKPASPTLLLIRDALLADKPGHSDRFQTALLPKIFNLIENHLGSCYISRRRKRRE